MVNLFAHRGFHFGDILQNTVESLNAAHENHFQNIEFDIWFFNEKLVITHDAPTNENAETLPTLREYFSFKNDFTYWLDLKNLDEKNADVVLKMVKEEIEVAGLDMDKIYFAPCILNYEIAPKIGKKVREIFGAKVKLMAICREIKDEAAAKNLHDFLKSSNIKFLSILHELVDEKFVKKFSGIEFFAWTVNDLKRLQELETLGVKNFATDTITPQIYEGKTGPSRS